MSTDGGSQSRRHGALFAPLTAPDAFAPHHLGLSLGGPGQCLAQRLPFPVSKNTLLRIVRARSSRPSDPLRAVGIDGWAWKRGHRYGTIVCDLERHRTVDVLPDREAATVEVWLTDHPRIEVVSPDRGGGYGQAVTRTLPDGRRAVIGRLVDTFTPTECANYFGTAEYDPD